MKSRAVWLALERDPVLAFLHLPENDALSGATAVLLCPVFGWEEMSSYRRLRVWAQALATAGHPTAMFGLPGAADSGGSPRDPGQLDAWTATVTQAAGWLASATGAERVTAIGAGVGGLLACSAVAAGAPIDDLILWAVPARGGTWLRELRAYARIVASRRPEDHRPETDPDGDIEYIGFLVSAQTAEDLEALQLTDLKLPAAQGRRVLLLGRDGIGPDKALRAYFEAAGADVTVQDTNDYSALMLQPQDPEMPHATIAKTIAWLSQPGPSRRAPEIPWHSPAPGRPSSELELTSVELPWNGATIRETLLDIDGPGGRLFGVLSEGVEAEAAPVSVVWLNGGALRHTGPNRAWVEAARRWAGWGVPCVRVDLEGIGDSDGQEGRVSNPDLYATHRMDEILAVLDHLSERGLPNRYVLGGLCSGAYWSLRVALTDQRVAGTLMINLFAFLWSELLAAERETRGSLSALRGYGWRRLAHRDLTLAHVRTVASSLRPHRLRAGTGRAVERAQSADIEAGLDQLRDRGIETLMLFSRGEGMLDQLQRQGVLDRLDRWPNLVIDLIPSTDHMFRALWLQRHVHASMDRAIERVLAAGALARDG